MEIWKDIKGYEKLYQVSNLGNIISFQRGNTKGKMLNPAKNNRGYLRVALCLKGKVRYDSVHRLVAETFIPNPQKLPEVNHIDGNKLNNKVTNLEWVTKGQNQIHAYKTGLRKTTQKQRETSRQNIKIARMYKKKGSDKKMNVKKQITMNWDEAPDTITPEIYAKIRGHSDNWARERFKEKNFPRIESGKMTADKTAVRLYDMGIIVKNNPKQSIEYLILLELQKLNERSENK